MKVKIKTYNKRFGNDIYDVVDEHRDKLGNLLCVKVNMGNYSGWFKIDEIIIL